MDEGDSEDVTEVSAVEGAHIQVKESDVFFKAESCNVSDSQETIIPREGNYLRSSIQEFMDLLDGKNLSTNVYLSDALDRPPAGSAEGAEGRVQELTPRGHSAMLGKMNESEMVDAVENQWWPLNQLAGGSEAGSSHVHNSTEDKVRSTSSICEDDRDPSFADFLSGQPSYQDCNLVSGRSTGESARNVFSSGVIKTKIISKAGAPEYFVKNTLKGKGILCRWPLLASSGADKGQTIMKDATATTVSSDVPLNLRAKSIIQTTHKPIPEPDICVSLESCVDRDSLRELLKSGRNKVHKISSFSIFRQILDIVDSSHSKGKVLQDLRPSSFKLLPYREVKYCGRFSIQMETHGSIVQKDMSTEHKLKRPLEQDTLPSYAKQQKVMKKPQLGPTIPYNINVNVAGTGASSYGFLEESHLNMDFETYSSSTGSYLHHVSEQLSFFGADQLEEKWYRSPEELARRGCTFSSNIYSLGVLLFELLSYFESAKAHAAAMSDLRHRVLPPNFLSENLKEAGFCLWLLHPEPSFRPTTRDILQSEVITGFQELCGDDMPSSIHQDETESELLLHFLMSIKEQKQKHASKLEEDIRCIEADIKEVVKRNLLQESLIMSSLCENTHNERGKMFLQSGDVQSSPLSKRSDSKLLRTVEDLESAYFSVRSKIQLPEDDPTIRPDRDLLKNRINLFGVQKDEEAGKSVDHLGAFFDGFCKYARYSKLEVCGTLRNGDFSNSVNVICSLSFDRDEDYFAAAGVSKKIKIFDFQALCNNTVDIHYPVTKMTNKSKISCICWNNYIRNYLASTDYDGVVKVWDASTGQGFYEYMEHERRAWSVDFSRLDPTRLASGSDDFSVKLWSINERSCLHTIRNIANVCCVQFSSHSSHLLAFGSADFKLYCYDLRNINVPWCILSGHEKAVSHVKFVDSDTIVSASTDNTLKLWDLKKSSSVGLSINACSLTLRGHTNEKNFVGLSVADGYIACGSETNEVYTYYKSFPIPITSHKFGSIDPVSGKEIDDDNGQFVSSVCWRGKSNVIVAANSTGSIKVLRMV
ncbi:hypothetical protein Ancab_032786 [Ancistrocladus abbreviatus]